MSQLWVMDYGHDCVHARVRVHVLVPVSLIHNNDSMNRTVKEDCANNIQAQSDTPNDEHHLGVMNI